MENYNFKEKNLLSWYEDYKEKRLTAEERKELFGFLNQNTKAKDAWEEMEQLESILINKSKEKAFIKNIKTIEAASRKSNKRNFTLPYFKWTSVAAAILLIGLSSLITWSISNKSQKENTHQYLQLRKDVENIKQSQYNIIKNINNKERETAWESKFTGSGFNIHPEGYIITNYHVVEDANEIMIENYKGEHFPAYIAAFESAADIAILKVIDSNFYQDFKTLPFLLEKKASELAEPIFSLGYPLENIIYHEGYVSGELGYANNTNAYLLEITSDPGQSGAPVFNKEGNLVGMITGKMKNTSGKTYAIHTENILNLLNSLPEENAISYKQTAKLKNLDRTQQVQELRSFIYSIKAK